MIEQKRPSMSDGFCLISSVKNEGPWLLEWIAHNKAIGFDDIIIGSNDCDDGTDLMLKRLQGLGYLKHFNNPGPYPEGSQIKAFETARCFSEVGNAKWIMILDADEFLNIHLGEGKLEDIVKSHDEDTDGIIFNWRVFGDSGQSKFEDIPVCDFFTKAYDNPKKKEKSQVKTLFRNKFEYKVFSQHGPWLPQTKNNDGSTNKIKMCVRTAAGKPVRNDIFQLEKPIYSIHSTKNSWSTAQVNHYIVKTKDVFDLKKSRGRGAEKYRYLRHSDKFFLRMNQNIVEDTSISRTSFARNKILDQLKTDCELAKLHAESCRILKQKIEANTLNPDRNQ